MNQFVCNQCGASFEQKARYDGHMAAPHARRTVRAKEVADAMRPIDFPKTKAELLGIASVQMPMDASIVEALESLPDRTYGSADEVARAFEGSTKPSARH